jgi:hypothetical protein
LTNKKTRPTLNLTVSLIVILAAWITPWAHAAETTNRIAANRIAANRIAANRIAANRIAANRIAANKISFNRLQANSEADEILGTADGRELYSYIVSCALPEKESIETKIPGAEDTAPPDTLYTCSNEHCVFPGSVGLAEDWIDHPLNRKGQRWITACLLARVNAYGISQKISLRGVAPELSISPDEAKTYSLQEGAFYGDIFGDPDGPLDWNACRGKDQAAGESGGLEMRDCTEPDPNDASHTKCGFKYAGDCGNYTRSFTQLQACQSFDPEEGTFSECLAPQEYGHGPSLKIYREVITTYVNH